MRVGLRETGVLPVRIRLRFPAGGAYELLPLADRDRITPQREGLRDADPVLRRLALQPVFLRAGLDRHQMLVLGRTHLKTSVGISTRSGPTPVPSTNRSRSTPVGSATGLPGVGISTFNSAALRSASSLRCRSCSAR